MDSFYLSYTMKQLSILLLSALGLFAEQPTEQTFDLKLQFEPGKTYVWKQDMEMKMEMKSPLGEGTMKMDTEMGMDYVMVAKKDEKGVRVEMGVDSMSMISSMDGNPVMNYNSEDEGNDSNPIAQAMAPLLDMEFTAIYDEDGKVVEVEAPESTPVMAQMGVDTDQFSQMFEQASEMYPDTPVKIGESWEYTQVMPMGALAPEPLELTCKCTLEGIEELDGQKCAKITFTTPIDTEQKFELESFSLAIENLEGVYWHDLALNMTRKTEMTTKMVMGATEGSEIAENGIGEMPYEMVVTQTLKEVK